MNWNEIRKKDYEYDEDASYNTWENLYRKVYSKIEIFNVNFDFERPYISGGEYKRIKIGAKENCPLIQKYKELLKENEVPIDKMKCGFEISGDTDFNITEDYHRFDNYSLCPVTGALNNEKGRKNGIEDKFTKYIQQLPQLIESPTACNGNYNEALKDSKEKIVKCARMSYWSLFNNDIKTYYLKTYLFDVNERDDLYYKAMSLFEQINNYKKYDDESEIAKRFWDFRREILRTKYNIDLNESGQFVSVE